MKKVIIFIILLLIAVLGWVIKREYDSHRLVEQKELLNNLRRNADSWGMLMYLGDFLEETSKTMGSVNDDSKKEITLKGIFLLPQLNLGYFLEENGVAIRNEGILLHCVSGEEDLFFLYDFNRKDFLKNENKSYKWNECFSEMKNSLNIVINNYIENPESGASITFLNKHVVGVFFVDSNYINNGYFRDVFSNPSVMMGLEKILVIITQRFADSHFEFSTINPTSGKFLSELTPSAIP